MKKKLLHKTLRVYLLFSLVVLVISAPVFYYFTERLFIEDADETLFLYQKEFYTNNLPSMRKEEIEHWNNVSRDIKIEPGSLSEKDSVYYHFYLDSLANENEPYRVLVAPIKIGDKPYTFLARVSLIETEDLIQNIAMLFCAVLILLLTGLYFITRALSTRLWRPFYSTLDKVEQFELDKNVSPEFTSTDVEEFARLNQSIHRLLEKNLSIYKSQKEFIENAAHELQTPLAVFQAKLDVLVQQVPFTDELGNTLTHLSEAASRLKRINKNLLLLSKIENNQYALSDEVDVKVVLEKQLSFFSDQAQERNISIHILNTEPTITSTSSALLELAISNLVLNALRYNIADGQIEISLGKNGLVISNTSTASELPHEKLFQRFAHTGSEGGNGLGLAIVKKISDLHSWTLHYRYEHKKHYFQLIF